MNNNVIFCLSISIVFFISVMSVSYVQAQLSPNMGSKIKSGNATSVLVSSSVSVPVSNETLKSKEGLLRSAVINFLNSGPNVLKSSPTDQPAVKSKIANQISKDTQNVEGIEATNAIIGVEVAKALKQLISAGTDPNQTSVISIDTTSKCTPTNTLISCDNSVTIR